MASIEQRGDSYLVSVSNGFDGRGNRIRVRRTFKKPSTMTPKAWEKELNRLVVKFEQEVISGTNINSNTTLKEFTDKWFKEYAAHNLELKTISSYKSELNNKILPALGHLRLNKLTSVKILSFLNNLLEDGVRLDGKPGGYSDRTIKYQWQILSSILQQGVYWQVIPNNPCQRVQVPKNRDKKYKEYSNAKVKFFTPTQILILTDIVREEPLKYQIAFNIALLCGLRHGEILGLTWNDINFKDNTISINKARTYIPGQGMITKEPKAKSSIRVISAPSSLIKLLRGYKLWQNGERAKCGNLWSQDWDKFPWLMTQWNGKGMHYDTLSSWLKKLIVNYNKDIENDKDKLPVLSFHKLRHTSATLLIGENTDIKTVSRRLGHAQASTTMNIYVHGLMETDKKASDTLEQFFNQNIVK